MIATLIINLLPRVRTEGSGPGQCRSGFTLVELVLSMGIMSILLMGISSAILLASKALPSPNSVATRKSDAAAALNQLSADLTCATAITELTDTAITITVADRGHGAAGPETIRWAWSGTAGAPLTRQYNGGTPATVASNVTAFSLTPTLAAGTLTSAPRVLMVVDRKVSLWDPWETTQVAKMQKWGFSAVTLRCDATTAEFNAAAANADVVFVTLYATQSNVTPMLLTTSCGVVVECSSQTIGIGVASTCVNVNGTSISSIDTSHPITAGLAPSSVTIVTASNQLSAYSGLAPAAKLLVGSPSTLCVLEAGESLLGGGIARGRRALLPWGGTSFDNQELNANGWTLVKRSLAWAAAPSVYDSVQVSFTVGSNPASATKVELLNHPKVPRP